MGTDASTRVQVLWDAALRGELTETDAQRLHALGPEAVTLFALARAHRVTELEAAGAKASTPDPATPSGQVPVLHQAGGEQATQTTRSQAGPSRYATPASHEDRRTPGPPFAAVSTLRRGTPTLESHPHACHRRHP